MKNRVRIIGGQWRSRLIEFPANAELRPTPDRVRETLFNWLGQDLSGKSCLDLFAGSGALGFEAASRSAARVVMVEHNVAVYNALLANVEKLGATRIDAVHADALQFLRVASGAYDVIFLDPPFASDALPRALALTPPHLREDGSIYIESRQALEPRPGWRLWRSGRAGQVHYQLLKWNGGAD